MGEAAKSLEKSTVLEPFTFMGPTKLFRGADSSFQVWQKPSIGDDDGEEGDNHNNTTMANHSLDHADPKNLTNTSQNSNGQAVSKHQIDPKLGKEDDAKRMKRMKASRDYSKKYRMKKVQDIENLENLGYSLKKNISNMRMQIEQDRELKRALLIEHHQLKFGIATLEKDRIVKEVEIEKKIAEVNRLREIQMKQSQAEEHPMPNLDENAQLDLNMGAIHI